MADTACEQLLSAIGTVFIMYRIHSRRFAIRTAAFLAGLLVSISLRIAGFAVQAFPITPLGTFLASTAVYVWLVDLLCRTHGDLVLPETGRPLRDRLSDISYPRSSMPAPVPPEKPTVDITRNSTFRVSFPHSKGSRSHGSPGLPAVKAVDVIRQATPQPMLLKPTIRRSSQVPSWLDPGIKPAETATDVSHEAAVSISKHDKSEHEQCLKMLHLPGKNVRNGDIASEPLNFKPRAQPSEDCLKALQLQAERQGTRSGGVSDSIRSSPVAAASIGHQRAQSLATLSGVYNDKGTRLDSPLEVSVPFSLAKLQGQAKVRRSSHDQYAGRSSMLSPGNAQSGDQSRTTSSGASSLQSFLRRSGRTSTLASAFSLSHFPRPPAPSPYKDRKQDVIDDGASDDATTALGYAAEPSLMSPLDMPKMPAAHQHKASWASQNTFTGTESGLVVPHKGFNVTSWD